MTDERQITISREEREVLQWAQSQVTINFMPTLNDIGKRYDAAPQATPPNKNTLGPFARDSKTSRASALANYPRSGSQRERVLREIEKAGRRGATREEISFGARMNDNSVRPRVRELIDGRFIVASDATRPTRSGGDAEILFLTTKAVAIQILKWRASRSEDDR